MAGARHGGNVAAYKASAAYPGGRGVFSGGGGVWRGVARHHESHRGAWQWRHNEGDHGVLAVKSKRAALGAVRETGGVSAARKA